ncbi:flavin reductase family protein [Jeotgalibacillus campisalis]|uniref:Flavin oxidoreductase n=1 Tax=Jeotgalibacillus campisalis TaxID=220754 RepID=A0A0C2VDW5_9BACL|nr:flavin reductase family protein [Jeotgalibacillus campisalis]KIL47112.1 flavin oxidoreductase [Jeotgalibacillus campisalis]
MRKKVNKTVMHSYPGMVALVTVHLNGEDNMMAAGWHSYISMDPPLYGVAIGRDRHTYHMLKEAGAFAVQFVPFELAQLIQESGVYSGSEKNKLAHIGFERGETTSAPILNEAYVAYELTTIDRQTYGDHDWFVGEINTFYKDEEKFSDNGLPDFQALSIPLYLGRSSYAKLDSGSIIRSFPVDRS